MDSEKINTLKKYALFGSLGIILIFGLLGTFVPDVRQFLDGSLKTVLAIIPSLAN